MDAQSARARRAKKDPAMLTGLEPIYLPEALVDLLWQSDMPG